VTERDIIPVFKELFALRKKLDESARRKMLGIQTFLRETVLD
jgi:hypothetical protein